MKKQALLVLVLILLSVYLSGCIHSDSLKKQEREKWEATHSFAASVDEAVKQFGDDLLIDKMPIEGRAYQLDNDIELYHAADAKDRKD